MRSLREWLFRAVLVLPSTESLALHIQWAECQSVIVSSLYHLESFMLVCALFKGVMRSRAYNEEQLDESE